MIRLAISVEGQTEEDFVKSLLAEHLGTRGVYSTPILLGRARSRRGGGDVTLDRLAKEMRHLQYRYDAVTSLVDFYGLRDKDDRRPDELIEAIQERIGPRDKRFVFPYVQLHEFEGLLFSDVRAFGQVLGHAPVADLASIRGKFPTPEDINDDSATAPSKRIARLIPGYRKRRHGPRVAGEIGLGKMRRECPRFAKWLGRLESLGSSDP